jgi:hypothetical protein
VGRWHIQGILQVFIHTKWENKGVSKGCRIN